jgi:hypothetical protein
MHKFAILLKTYIGDIEYAHRLIESYKEHNKDKIPLYIVAPKSDVECFEQFVGENIELYSDQDITDELAIEPVRGIRPGYINQEIIKLAFWEKRLCENYLCVDSDGVFIRDFYVSDFMYDQDTPYTILVEDNELMVEPEYYETYWQGRYKLIQHIQNLIGLKDKRILTNHAFSIFSAKVLESFKVKYLTAKGQTYIDILAEAPYEFSWYNIWLQYDNTIDIHVREPLFKFFHHKNQHIEYMLRGIKTSDLARGYIGVNVNSNYSRDFGVISFEENRCKTLAQYFSNRDVVNILLYKLAANVTRLGKNIKRVWDKYVHRN